VAGRRSTSTKHLKKKASDSKISGRGNNKLELGVKKGITDGGR